MWRGLWWRSAAQTEVQSQTFCLHIVEKLSICLHLICSATEHLWCWDAVLVCHRFQRKEMAVHALAAGARTDHVGVGLRSAALFIRRVQAVTKVELWLGGADLDSCGASFTQQGCRGFYRASCFMLRIELCECLDLPNSVCKGDNILYNIII
eukprot:COSAG01_NODE_7229_length_3294_cov_4.483568_2_plen_152_part_00